MTNRTGEHNENHTTYKVIWQVDNSHSELAGALRETLKDVIDPEIGLSIIDLGLVRDVRIEDDHAEVTMILTTPFCPYGPAIMETTRKKTEGFLDLPTTIEMGMEPWDFSMMEEGTGGDWGLF